MSEQDFMSDLSEYAGDFASEAGGYIADAVGLSDEDQEVFNQAQGFASDAGEYIAELTGLEPAGWMVEGAAAAGAAIGVGIEHLTDGAISDGIADGLMGLVGEEHSLEAVRAFDDGDYLGGALEMAEGAAETVGEWAGDAVDAVGEFAGDAVDAVGDVLDSLNPFSD